MAESNVLADCGVASMHDNAAIMANCQIESEINKRAASSRPTPAAKPVKRTRSSKSSTDQTALYELIAKKGMVGLGMDRLEFARCACSGCCACSGWYAQGLVQVGAQGVGRYAQAALRS